MFHSIDNEVLELKRLKISNLTLDENLKSGEYRLLTSEELKLYSNKERGNMMAKSAGLLRIVAGIGAAAAAVALSRESSRNKLKAEYNKYKRKSRRL